MYLQVSVQVSLKGLPKGHLGLRGERWSIKTDENAPVSEAAVAFVKNLTEFWMASADSNDAAVKQQLDELVDVIKSFKIESVQTEVKQ